MRGYQPTALATLLAAAPFAAGFNFPHSTRAGVQPVAGFAQPSTRLFSTIDKAKASSSGSVSDEADKLIDIIDGVSSNGDAEASTRFLGKPVPYSELTVGVLKETYPGENRVSVAPESVKMLVDAGLSVVVESGGEYYFILCFVWIHIM